MIQNFDTDQATTFESLLVLSCGATTAFGDSFRPIGEGRSIGTGGGIDVGPFEDEPVELGTLLSEHFDDGISGEEIQRRCDRWLTERLEDAGIALGSADHAVAKVIASEGWSLAQIVAGWAARAETRTH